MEDDKGLERVEENSPCTGRDGCVCIFKTERGSCSAGPLGLWRDRLKVEFQGREIRACGVVWEGCLERVCRPGPCKEGLE